MRRLRKVPALGIAELRERRLWRCWRASCYRNVRAPDFAEHPVEQLGAHLRIAKRRGDAEDLQFGAAQGQRHRKRIVNVVADVGVNDDFFGRRRLRRGRPRRALSKTTRRDCDSREQQRKNGNQPAFAHSLSLPSALKIKEAVELTTIVTCSRPGSKRMMSALWREYAASAESFSSLQTRKLCVNGMRSISKLSATATRERCSSGISLTALTRIIAPRGASSRLPQLISSQANRR